MFAMFATKPKPEPTPVEGLTYKEKVRLLLDCKTHNLEFLSKVVSDKLHLCSPMHGDFNG